MTVTDIPLGRIHPAPWNANRMDKPMRRRLFSSLGRFGLVQPLVVRRQGDDYETVAGAQRLGALTNDGVQTVPCVILDHLGDADARLLSVALNRIGGTDDVNLLGDIAREVLAALPSEAIASVLPHSLDHLRGLASLRDLARTPSDTTTGRVAVGLATQAVSWERVRSEGFERISFALDGEQRRAVEGAVELALVAAPAAGAPNRRGVALARICEEWRQGRSDDSAATTPHRVDREGSR